MFSQTEEEKGQCGERPARPPAHNAALCDTVPDQPLWADFLRLAGGLTERGGSASGMTEAADGEPLAGNDIPENFLRAGVSLVRGWVWYFLGWVWGLYRSYGEPGEPDLYLYLGFSKQHDRGRLWRVACRG